MSDKEIFIEKLTELFCDGYLTAENHTNNSFITRYNTWLDIERVMEDENLNFLGVCTPPYNPYGMHLNYAFVMEDKERDYEICWHHVSDMWLNEIAKSLGIEYRFKC
jgi:hypothetical protein